MKGLLFDNEFSNKSFSNIAITTLSSIQSSRSLTLGWSLAPGSAKNKVNNFLEISNNLIYQLLYLMN